MKRTTVLIADDSVVYRSQIRAAFASMPNVEVVATAANGRQAIERLASQAVDLVTLDLEMPEMDGLETLREIKRLNILSKVLVFSSFSKRGADITLEALRLGASDFVTKPGPETMGSSPEKIIAQLLREKVAALCPATIEPRHASPQQVFPKVLIEAFRPRIIVIASSTGGPTALDKIFSELHGQLEVPILIAQHMPPIFTASLAERLARKSGLIVKEAVHNEPVQKNRVYVAPGDYHMRVELVGNEPVISLDQGPQIHSVRPSAEPLFESVSKIYGASTMGIVLTGMGADGSLGSVMIKKLSGLVVIQEESSCVVFGMPGAVKALGSYDREANLEEISKLINEKAIVPTANLSQAIVGRR